MSEPKHTPIPWAVVTSRDVHSAIVSPGVATICIDVENDANAEFICLAVNNHAKLVGMVEVLVDMIDDLRPHSDRIESQARELLANVKENTN